MAKKQLGTRHDEEMLDAVARRASELDMSLTRYVDMWLMVAGTLDAEMVNAITAMSKKLDVSRAEFIKFTALKWIATHDAQLETYGKLKLDAKLDFIRGDTKTTYIVFKERAVKEYEREVLESVLKDETSGKELSGVQKRIAMKYRYGKTWLQSAECAEELGRRAELERIKAEFAPHMEKLGIVMSEHDPDENVTDEDWAEWETEAEGE